MFFDNPEDILKIAARTSCGIFVLAESGELRLSNATILAPEEDKKSIGIEEVRSLTDQAGSKQSSDRFFVINPADALTIQAQNALLKNLEEPKAHYHYILLTKSPSLLLPTVRSRAQTFYQKVMGKLSAPVLGDEKAKNLARELIAAHPSDLPILAEKISKDKRSPRLLAIQVASTAIEILEKSYFKTGNLAFLNKLPKFIALADALDRNGNIKLHIIADLC